MDGSVLKQIAHVDRLYAFDYQPTTPFRRDGWQVYRPLDEYHRLGVASRFPQWRISDVNRGFEVRYLCLSLNRAHWADVSHLSTDICGTGSNQ